MSIDVVMPKLGESITEGTILEWKKKLGKWSNSKSIHIYSIIINI